MKTRKVFGRLTIELGGKPTKVEMRRDGLHFRAKYARTVQILRFAQLADLLEKEAGQYLLFPSLQPASKPASGGPESGPGAIGDSKQGQDSGGSA